MKIIYATKSAGIDEDGSFQNPKYFDRPDTTATSVLIYGDYPEIKAAYDALGVEVEVRKPPQSKPLQITVNAKVGITPDLQKIVADAKAECEKVLAENESLEAQLKSAVEDMETERVARITFMNDVGAMQTRIDELKSAAENLDPSTEQPIEVGKEIELPKSTENDFASWTIPQIKDYLAAKEIGFKASASKDELLALIPKE